MALRRRVLYGFTTREGPRYSEAIALTWADVDLDHGVVTLTQNKTNDPRAWSLAPDVAEALTAWKALTKGKPGQLVFGIRKSASEHQADRLRADLVKAGVTRTELHNRDQDAARRPLPRPTRGVRDLFARRGTKRNVGERSHRAQVQHHDPRVQPPSADVARGEHGRAREHGRGDPRTGKRPANGRFGGWRTGANRQTKPRENS